MSVRLPLLALGLSILGGCATQAPLAPAAGKFIDSPQARPLGALLQADNPWVNNAVVDYLAGSQEPGQVRGFGEINLTQQMGQVGSFRAPAMQAYVEQVLQRLLAQWPHDKPDIRVRFSLSESYGAYCTEQNEIYLSLGTLQAIESEDELAALLGHEAAHLLLGHMEREHFFNQQKKLLDASVNLVNTAVTLSGLENQGRGGSVNLVLGDPDAVGKTVVQSTLSGLMVQAVADNIWNSSWNREQEDQADLLSIDLLTRAGYSPRGALYSIQRLRSFEGVRKSQLAQFRDQQGQLFDQAFDKKGLGGLLEQSINSSMGVLMLGASDVWSNLGSTHYAPEVREQQLQRYLSREYRRERRRTPRVQGYQRQLLGESNGRLLADHVLINRATRSIAKGEREEALRLAARVEEGPSRGTLHAQTLQYVLWLSQGRSDAALESLEAVKDEEWQYASLANYDQIIASSLSQGKAEQAQRFLLRGQQVWGRELMAPLEISVALQHERLDSAQAAYQRCQSSKSKALKEQCGRHIGRYKPVAETPQLLPGVSLPKFGSL